MNTILEKFRADNPELATLNDQQLGAYFYEKAPHPHKGNWDAFAKRLNSAGVVFPEPESPEPPGALARVGRGVADMAQGVKQLYKHATDPEGAKEYDAQIKQELEYYNKALDKDSIDWWRIGGNVIAAAPLALVPGGQTMASQSAIGVGLGALGAGTMVTETEGDAFWADKTIQTGAGAALGGAAPKVLQIGKGVLENLSARAKTAWMRLADNGQRQLMITVSDSLRKVGVAWDELGDEVKRSLLNDGLEQLENTGKLDPDALMRKSLFDKYGYKPTTAQVTRNPAQWQYEKDISKVDGVGDPLRQRYIEQNEKLLSDTERLANRFGPDVDDYGTAKGIQGVAEDMSKASQKQVSKAYDNIPNSWLDWEGLHYSLKTVRDQWEDQIPAPIMRRMDELIKGTREPTVDSVNRAIKLLNQRQPTSPNEAAAYSAVRGALHTALDEAALQGAKGADQIIQATRLAAKRFGLIKGSGKNTSTIVSDLIDNKANLDRYVSNRIMGGQTEDLFHLRRFLEKMPEEFGLDPADGKQAWDMIRARVLRNLNYKAGHNDDATLSTFNGKRWRKEWDKLGARRDALFDPHERSAIEEMIELAENLTTEPPFSYPNRSNTATSLINMTNRMANFPVLGDAMSMLIGASRAGKDAVAKEVQRQKAASAISGAPFVLGDVGPATSLTPRAIGTGSAAGGGRETGN